MWVTLGKFIVSFLTGGSLEKILDVINKKMSDDVKKEELKAEVTETWIKAQASLLVGRTWWFQLLFVIPLGAWFSAVILDSIFGSFDWYHHVTYALPEPLDDWAAWIISALFIVDGSKAVLGRWSK
jgi:hypothetical protein